MLSPRFRNTAVAISIFAIIAVFLIKGIWIEAANSEKPVLARITQSGRPWLNLQNGVESPTSYSANADLAALESAKPMSVFSADVNRDGFPDLITGYATANGGLAVIRFGDPEAFGPTKSETIEGIKNGQFPASFLPEATVLNVPETPDFLAVGDFDRDGSLDILTAARGSSEINVLSENHNSANGQIKSFDRQRKIDLPGQLTTLATGRDTTSPFDDLAAGIVGGDGAQILFYSTTKSVFEANPAIYELSSAATSITINQLDSRVPTDLAVTTDNDVLVIHGSDEKSQKNQPANFSQSQIEHLQIAPLSNVVIGDFIPDRENRMEIAVLSNDGMIHVEKRGQLDTRPFTAAEMLEKRKNMAEMRHNGNFGSADYSAWQPQASDSWSESQTIVADVLPQALNSAKSLLVSGNIGASAGDEILIVNPSERKVEILMNDTDRQTGSLISMQRSEMAIKTENTPIAAIPMRLNVMGQPGLVLLSEEKTDPILMPSTPEATFAVTKAIDTNDGTCNADCSLREAVVASNANGVGADIITFSNNVPVLTIAGSDNTSANGDLDINGNLTVMGNGAATTVIGTAYTAASASDGKIFGVNQDGTVNGLAVSFSGLTIQNGFNKTPCGTFEETGGGGDFYLTGTGNVDSMTNVIVKNNTTTGCATTSHGGGINVDSTNAQTVGGASAGTVTFTSCTFSGNKSDAEGGGLNLAADKHDVNINGTSVIGGVNAVDGNQTTVATSGKGGGLNIEQSNGGTVLISGTTTVQNNTAALNGGGINITYNPNVNITGASVLNNTSNSSGSGSAAGGGISINPIGISGFTPTITVSNSTISNNVAVAGTTGQGGGVYFDSFYSATVSNCLINGNSADRGAGVFNGGSSATPAAILTVNNGTIISNNTASASGGGVANVDSTGASTVLNGITVDNNTAASGGDGIDQTLDASGTGSTMALQGTINVNSGDSVFISRGNLSVPGTANITGSLTNAGGTVSIPGTVNLGRDFTFSSGAFSQNSGTVNFNGTVAQQITGGATSTFFNLTDSNTASTLSVNNNTNVNSALTVNANTILNPAAAAVIGGTGTLTGSGTIRTTRTTATADFLSQYTITNKTLTNLTVDYFGAGAQTINALPYGGLRTSTSGVKTLSGTSTVNGSSIIGTGTTLTLAGNTLNIGGDLTNNGAFSGGFANSLLAPTAGGKIVMNGTVAQNINGTTATTFNDLQINNANGVTFSQNGAVNGILTLTNGNISMGANTLTIGSAGSVSRTSGYVIGKVAKIFGGAGSFIYPVGTANGYSPVNTTVSSGSGVLTINATQGVHPNVPMPGSAIARYWTLTGTGMTASFTFNYLQSDVIGPNENQFDLIKINNGSVTAIYPNAPNSVIINPAANTATINNISSFSDWTLGEAVPTAASSSITGKVLTANGRGIGQATLKLIDSNGRTISVKTNSFGNFNFANLPSGQNYILFVSAKGYQFSQSSSVVNLQQNLSDLNFTATR